MRTFRAEMGEIICTSDRNEWRCWLQENFETSEEAWLSFPTKSSGEPGITYNDAVEEALCFGWIDSITKNLDENHHVKRFTPRRKGSSYSRPNIERLIGLDSKGMIHPSVREQVEPILKEKYVFPKDIIRKLKKDETVWQNFQSFSDSYKRIRVDYIDAARDRPEEFNKRLNNFINKTRENKLIIGYGGVDKYY